MASLVGRAKGAVRGDEFDSGGGILMAHASLVTGELGIPAEMGVGEAAIRFRDGQVVGVESSVGAVLSRTEQPSRRRAHDFRTIAVPRGPPPSSASSTARAS